MTARYALPLLLLAFAAGRPEAARAAVIVVNSNGDTADGDTGSIAALIAAPGPDGRISLREAITAANNTPGTDDVTFLIDGIGHRTIPLTSLLPEVTDPIRINGTCLGTPCIKLRGTGTTFGFAGLTITAGQSVVEGLALSNLRDGIVLRGGGGNVVKRCYIGVDFDGVSEEPNGTGIRIESAGNTIGTGAAGEGNVISGNVGAGIRIFGNDNAVLGNYIGTTIENADLGNGGAGVRIVSGSDNRIGRPGQGNANTIGFNFYGVEVRGPDAQGNAVENNFIGVDRDGDAIGNRQSGVVIHDASGNTVGGIAEARRNAIAYNGGAGVLVMAPEHPARANAVRHNHIYGNAALGIDLVGPAVVPHPYGVQPNDAGDADDGPNGLQNFPELAGAAASAGGLAVSGALRSRPSTTYRVELYANAAADPSGHGEGQRYLGALDVTTDAVGLAPIVFTGPAVAVGHHVVATATDPDGNTSEFSNAVEVVDDTPSQTVEYANLTGDGDLTNVANYVGGLGPTANDAVSVRAGTVGTLAAGAALQVRQLNVAGNVAAPTTVTIGGTLIAEALTQTASTTVEVVGGTVVVAQWTDSGGTMSLGGAATVTSPLGDGAFTAGNGAAITVSGGANVVAEGYAGAQRVTVVH